jgi:predicted small lipoprotein YifL
MNFAKISGIFLMMTLLLFTGCGKKGPLIPPEALVPATVTELRVQQQGGEFRITWQAPTKEQNGRPLRDLAGFRLLRRDILNDGSDCAACPDSWKQLVVIDPDLAQRSGPNFIYRDYGVSTGSVSQYRLLALSRSGGSSQAATSRPRKLQPVIPAPAAKATALPASIEISVTCTVPAAAKLLGFNIYRRLNATEPVLMPLNGIPIPQAVWEDQQLQFGQTYRYSVTALVETGGETVESLPSPEVEILFTRQEIR